MSSTSSQTKLLIPYASLRDSVLVLDTKRLRAQAHSARQRLLTGALAEWEGCSEALALYGWLATTELRRRGCTADRAFFGKRLPRTDYDVPEWLSDDEVLLAHRAELLKENSKWYGKLWEAE